MIRTPHTGVQFKQNGKIIPVIFSPDRSFSIVHIARQPFEMSILEREWEGKKTDDLALAITVSTDSKIFQFVNFNKKRGESSFFNPGTGTADDGFGSGKLVSLENLTDPNFTYDGIPHFPNNYVIGGRFNVEDEHSRGIFISSVWPRYGDEKANLLKTAKALYMVFLIDAPNVGPSYEKWLNQSWEMTDLDLLKVELMD